MNNEPSDEKRRLLNEVFRADAVDAFSGQLKLLALAEFRRARFIRRTTSVLATVAIAAALIAGGLLFRASERTKTIRLATVPPQSEGMHLTTPQPNSSASNTTLTDEQLLAFFPSDSCFLA